MPTTLELLTQVREKLATPGVWLQGSYAVDKTGKKVSSCDREACRFCLVGAITHVCPDLKSKFLCESNLERILSNMGFDSNLIGFNDSHTLEDVLHLINDTLEYLKGETNATPTV